MDPPISHEYTDIENFFRDCMKIIKLNGRIVHQNDNPRNDSALCQFYRRFFQKTLKENFRWNFHDNFPNDNNESNKLFNDILSDVADRTLKQQVRSFMVPSKSY